MQKYLNNVHFGIGYYCHQRLSLRGEISGGLAQIVELYARDLREMVWVIKIYSDLSARHKSCTASYSAVEMPCAIWPGTQHHLE